MKRISFLLLVGLIVLLAACVEGEEAVVESTAVPTPQPTIEPTVTETAVATITPTEDHSSEDLAIFDDRETDSSVSHIPESSPLPTGTPTPIFLPISDPSLTLPAIETNHGLFTLKSPDPVLLLELLVTLSAEAKRQKPTMFQFEELLMSDIQIYYENELPIAYLLLADNELRFFEQISEPLQSNWEVIRTAVIQYLNDNSLLNAPALSLQLHSLDLDIDGQEDVLVEFSALDHSISGLIPLQILADGSYRLIPNDFPPESTYILYENEVFLDEDVTGDEQSDVIWHTRSYWGRGYFEEIRVFYWDGQKLSLLEEINLSRSAEDFTPQFVIDDFNNDSFSDIQIKTELRGNFECDMQMSEIYSWSNAQVIVAPQAQVNTPACYIWKSLRFNEDPEQTAASLHNALSGWEPTDTTNASLIALARVHLAMAQAAMGQIVEAQATLDELYNLPSDAHFVQLVKQVYESAGKRPLQTCRNLLAISNELLETEIGHYLSWEAADPYMATWGDVDGALPHAETICNFNRTAEHLLQNMDFPAETSPLDLLKAQNIPYEFAVQANLDDDLEREWIGVLDLPRPAVLEFDLVDNSWQPSLRWLFLDKVTNFSVISKDVTGDGLDDIIGLVSGRDFCSNLETEADSQAIWIIYTEDTSARFFGDSWNCLQGSLLKPSDISQDNFRREEPTTHQNVYWRTLENYSPVDLSLAEYSQGLQTAVLAQTDPAIPEKITQLLNYLPANDPEAQPYSEHLTYLLGYFYELNGNEENAVNTYLDLIQQYPTSPWSWLAWARLEPVEN